MVDTLARPERRTAETHRFEEFRDAVSQAFVPLAAATDSERTFEGAVTQAELGPLRLAQVTAGAHVVGRTSRLIRRADPECYKLSLQVSGRAVLSQDDREAVLVPGDLVLYDTTRPYELRFDGPFRMIVLMFSRSLLQVPESSVRLLTGHRLPGDDGLGMLIGPFVQGISRQVDHCTGLTGRCLCDAVLDMLAAALVDELSADGRRATNGPRQAALLERIKSYIDEGLAEPELGPAQIAAAHHISPRYLRKLFEGEGDSVGRWIRSRRLQRCRSDLGHPALSDRSVSAVAARWGFTDAAHFSRLFKSVYGQSPREYRSVALSRSRPTLVGTA